MIKFKDLRVVDMRPGEPDEVQHQAHRAKKTSSEALNVAQRLKRGRIMKRNKAKLKIGRDRAAKRTASKETLAKRSRRAARNIILKKMTKGISKSDLSMARRKEIESRIDKMGSRVNRLAVKLAPKLRASERDRKRGSK